MRTAIAARRLLWVADLPSAVISHVAKQIHLEVPTDLGYDRRTLYRHHQAIRQYLGITPWGAQARGIASTAIAAAVRSATCAGGGDIPVACGGFRRLALLQRARTQ
jgi:hypothetical protein